MAIDTYLQVVFKIHFVILTMAMAICCQMGNTSSNHTALGHGHNSLDSLNPGKVI